MIIAEQRQPACAPRRAVGGDQRGWIDFKAVVGIGRHIGSRRCRHHHTPPSTQQAAAFHRITGQPEQAFEQAA